MTTEQTPTSNAFMLQHITETRAAIKEIREDIGAVREMMAKLPFDVQDERRKVVERRLDELEYWRKGLWKNLAVFVAAMSAMIQGIVRLVGK